MMRLAVILVLLFAAPAAAQQPQPFTPPDQELWEAMTKALSDLSMPLTAHQQVQRILSDVLREAQAREARKAATQKKE